jgi:hypothetical protein
MGQRLCIVDALTSIKTRLMERTCDCIILIKSVIDTSVLFAVKRSKYIFILLSLVGCNRALPIQKMLSIEPALQPYVQEFEAAGASVGHKIIVDNLSMHFVTNLPAETLGECWMMNRGASGTPRIFMNANVWPSLTVSQQKAVAFHELAHCVLWLVHDTTWITMGINYIPRSIMYPYIQSGYVYDTYWSYYVNELFNGP